jgi:hypothetical protein
MSRVLALLNDYLTRHEADELKAELEQAISITLKDHTFRFLSIYWFLSYSLFYSYLALLL